MSILTVELPTDLVARLEAAAGAVPEEKARLVQTALERLFDERASPPKSRKASRGLNPQPFPNGQTFLDVMGDLCGKYEGPGDLSTNPKYMEGFGED